MSENKAPEVNIFALIARIRRANTGNGMPLLSGEMADIIQVITHLEQKCAELEKSIEWSIQHLSTMDNYSVVNGALFKLKEVLERYGK